MTTLKKSKATKFVPDDISEFMNESQFLKDSPKDKKIQKRKRAEVSEEEDISKLIGQYQASVKKKKAEASPVAVPEESRQKLLHVMSRQLESRKQGNEHLLKNLSEVLTQLEADYNAMKENEQKLEHLTGAFMKCIQQSTMAFKQKLKSLKDIQVTFKKEVEGLISRGALHPDDRPLWFDVYKAFPPITEPKFARPKPEIKPMTQILYKEDALRAEFHSKGYGLSAVNMLSPSSETQTKRLLQQHEKLKSEGVAQSELIEKAAAAVESERQEVIASKQPKQTVNPESVTAKLLAEADLKNIFKDN